MSIVSEQYLVIVIVSSLVRYWAVLGKFLSLDIVTNNPFFGEHSHKTVPCNGNSIFLGESLGGVRSVSFTGHSHKIVPSLLTIVTKQSLPW